MHLKQCEYPAWSIRKVRKDMQYTSEKEPRKPARKKGHIKEQRYGHGIICQRAK